MVKWLSVVMQVQEDAHPSYIQLSFLAVCGTSYICEKSENRGLIWMPWTSMQGQFLLLLYLLFYLIYFIWNMKHVLDSTKDIFSLATNGILQNLRIPSPSQECPTLLFPFVISHIFTVLMVLLAFISLTSVAGCHLSNNV